MASAVATPLERRFGRIAGVTEITSTSALGTTSITLQFDLDRDVDGAARDVQAAITAAGGELPPNLPSRPNYRKVNPADAPILIISLTSEHAAARRGLRRREHDPRAEDLAGPGRRPGRSSAAAQQPAVRVQVDPDALAGDGPQHRGRPHGARRRHRRLSRRASLGGTSQRTIDRRERSALRRRGVQDGRRRVTSGGIGACSSATSRRVRRRREQPRRRWTNGERAVLMIIRRQPGANIIETNERVKALLPELATSISPAIKVEVARRPHADDPRVGRTTSSTRCSSASCSSSLVVFVFLRSLRATAIPSVAVPLVARRHVRRDVPARLQPRQPVADGADHLDRLRRRRRDRRDREHLALHRARASRRCEAALEGAQADRLHDRLDHGVAPRRVHPASCSWAASSAASSASSRSRSRSPSPCRRVVSLTLTPMMCARLLAPRTTAKHGRALSRDSSAVFDGIVARLRARAALGAPPPRRHRRRHVATIALTVCLYIDRAEGPLPAAGHGMLMGFTEAPQDISFPAMKERQEQLNAIVRQDPDVDHFVSFIGAGGGNTGNTGTMFIELKPKPRATASADEIIARLRPKLAQGRRASSSSCRRRRTCASAAASARTQYQYTLRTPTSTSSAPGRRRCSSALQQAARAQGRRTPISRPPASSSTSTSIATPRRASASRRRRSTTRSTTPSASARSRRPTRSSTSTASCSRSKPRARARARRARSALRRSRPTARRCRCRRIVEVGARRRPRSRSTTRGSSRRPRSRSTSRPASRSARRSTRSTAREPRSACRASDPRRRSRARRRRSRTRSRASRAHPRRARHRLHRARHALRELHPPDHDPVDAAVGGRRRAARAAPLQDRAQHHRADRRSSCSSAS